MTHQMKDGLVQRGTTWSYVVRVRDPLTGKKKAIMKGGFPTRQEAKTARDEARTTVNKGTAVMPTRLTVREYLEQWLEASGSRVRPTTLASYRQHVNGLIVPVLGGERLQELTPAMIDRLYALLLREGRKPKKKPKENEKTPAPTPLTAATVRRVGATLHKALSDAVKKRIIPYNPADAAQPPKIEQDADGAGETRSWTRKELDTFLAFVASDRLFALWRLAAWTGMRRGELAGLTWRDVDLEARTITVQRARVTVSSADVRESKPKTHQGRRQVELDVETAQALAKWQEYQKHDREEWPGEWPTHGLVFTLEDGSGLHPDYLTRTFQSLAKRAGVPLVRLHDLRHTHATLLLAAGVPVKVVSERLGHSTVAFTMEVYQHVLPGMQRQAVQALANAKTKPARHLRVVNG